MIPRTKSFFPRKTFCKFYFTFFCFILILSCQKDDTIVETIDEEAIEEKEEPPLTDEESQIVSLPIVSIDTNGAEIVDEPKVEAVITISVNDEIVNEGNIAIEFRGSTSQGFAKKSYGFETRDAANEDLDVALLGFPEEEDWILYGPFVDKSLVRNHLIFNLARDMGYYASRTKLVELNLNGAYQGIYVFMEKLKRDKNRIDINKLKEDENSGEDLTGGYIIKIDKESDGFNAMNSFESDASISGQNTKFLYEYPDPDEITEAQRGYIQNYILEFERVLASEAFSDPEDGYKKYIDTESFIDFFLLNELSNNTDAYRISTFLHKDKGERLKAGPIWDFNLAFGNGGRVNTWSYQYNDSNPTAQFLVPFWWGRLLEDPSYVNQLKERWSVLRADIFSMSAIQNRVDAYVEEIKSDKTDERNFERWPIDTVVWPGHTVRSSYDEETAFLLGWINERLTWMDGAIADL